MRKKEHKCYGFLPFVFVVLSGALLYNGCGIVSIMGTPTRHERKIRAEYDIGGETDQKILVLVSQPSWLDAQANLRYHLTTRINEELSKKTEIAAGNFVGYGDVSEFRSSRADFSFLSPTAVGSALQADKVFFVTINSYELNNIADTDYFKGFLSAECALYDVATGKRLWPVSAASRSVKVGFDVESRGREAAVGRLAGSLAYCTVRYFYDCPEDQFRIADDRSAISWGS